MNRGIIMTYYMEARGWIFSFSWTMMVPVVIVNAEETINALVTLVETKNGKKHELNACYSLLSALVGGVMAACKEVVGRVTLPVQTLVSVRRNAHRLRFRCSFQCSQCQVSAYLMDVASLQGQIEFQTSILFPTAAIPTIISAV